MNAADYTLWFVVPLLVLAQAVVLAVVFPRGDGRADGSASWGLDGAMAKMSHNLPGIAVLLISWLLITAIAWWIEFLVGLGALYLVLFVAGRWAAIVAATLLAAVFLLTPLVVGRTMLGMVRTSNRPTSVHRHHRVSHA